MPTRFATQFSNFAAPNLVRQFGETVTYYPHQGFGESVPSSRSIQAIVDRQQRQPFGEDVVLPVWTLTVENDGTSGITSAEIDLGGDRVSFAPRVGEVAAYHTITQLLSHDESMVRFECVGSGDDV